VFPEPFATLVYLYSMVEVDIWGGIGADCFVEGLNYHTRAIMTSIIPMAGMFRESRSISRVKSTVFTITI
jgi:hypothetical protein